MPLKKAKVSIIVPVYNVEQYLARCLDSLLSQTLKDIEIICINDGSSDGSPDILRDYRKRDKRIIVINQKNAGLSAARNAGIAKARAEFIMCCDSDDWFEPTMCEIMYCVITENNVDIAVCGINIIYETASHLRQSDDDYYRLKYVGKRSVSRRLVYDTDVSAWNKIYRKSILEEFHIEYPVGLFYEDAYFFNAYMSVAKSIYFVNQKLYNYVRRKGSIMSKTVNKDPRAIEHIYIAFELYDFLIRNDCYTHYHRVFWDMFIRYYWFARIWAPKNQYSEINRITRKFIHEHQLEIKKLDRKSRRELGFLGTFLYLPYTIPGRAARKLYRAFSPSYSQSQQILYNQKNLSFAIDSLSHRVENLSR